MTNKSSSTSSSRDAAAPEPQGRGGDLARLLSRAAVLAMLVGAVLGLVSWRLDHTITYFWELDYEELLEPKVRANVVILGTSHTKHGVDPRPLEGSGRRVFNFALNGATPVFYQHWYEKLFRSFYPKPDVILFGVDWFMWVEGWLGQRHFEQDSEYFPLPVFVRSLLDPGLDRKLLLKSGFLFVKERGHLPDLARASGRQPIGGLDLSSYHQGYIPWNRPYDGRPLELEHDSSPVQRQAFEQLLDRFEADGIRVVFFQTPEYRPGLVADLIAPATRQLHALAQQRSIPFLDYNDRDVPPLARDLANFSDWGHLNERGSAAFSRILADDLQW